MVWIVRLWCVNAKHCTWVTQISFFIFLANNKPCLTNASFWKLYSNNSKNSKTNKFEINQRLINVLLQTQLSPVTQYQFQTQCCAKNFVHCLSPAQIFLPFCIPTPFVEENIINAKAHSWQCRQKSMRWKQDFWFFMFWLQSVQLTKITVTSCIINKSVCNNWLFNLVLLYLLLAACKWQ